MSPRNYSKILFSLFREEEMPEKERQGGERLGIA